MTHEAYINPIKKRELPFCIWHYPRNIMWLYLTFLLIIGSAVADHQHAWETGNEYHFLIQSHTLTVLDKLANQFSGVYVKGGLTVQVKSSDTLQAVVSHTQYAPVHKVLPEGWNDAEVNNLKLQKLSMSEKPFEIKLKNGVIQDVLVDQDVPTWEVNLLKSIVSQLQIDIQGENAIGGRGTQGPDDNQPFGTFKVMEDSVGGKCEVVYDIMPLSLNALFKTPELVPLPNFRKGGLLIDITKTKNYTRCEQRMAYRSGIVGKKNWGPESNDGLLSRLSTSRIIVSGNLTRFTIQSSVTTNNIFVSSKIQDTYSGAVFVTVNLTLDRMSEISNLMPVSNNLVSTGNLVYTYNDPFSSQHIPSVSRDPLAARSSENRGSNSTSEESHINDNISSSSLSNSSSNNEERDLQPKLDHAPKSPILPFFFGDKDKSLVKDEENSAAARLIIWIASKMENYPDDMLREIFTDILERFTILVRLIRTMDVEQITELENVLSELLRDYNTSFTNEYQKLYNQTAWDVFCNAVTEAGTGPALITIKNWVINKKLGSMQAADIIPRIPKVALTPTAEYINAFFELITDEQVRKQRFLNTTAPLSFAELVRYTQNNKSSIYYSVYGVGRTVSKQDNALLETYIPYMATQLREAINESDSLRIQTYIMALGNFGHPKVLSVFEPYLEGTLPVSKFQRLMMVITLNKLGENFPRVARSVAYKIYVNMMEAYELRCAAVYVIMNTNPPLSMLQRMAEFTNQDEDHYINSAVKTSIEMLADLKQPEFQSLANKARIARKLLNPRIYENDSQSIFQKVISTYLNIDQTTILQTIGSMDNNITPKGVYFDIRQSFGGFNLPPTKLTYTMSHIRELLSDMWYQKTWLKNTEKKSIIEQTIEKLGIKPDNPEQFEGNIFIDSMLSSSFYPLDNNTFDEILDTWGRYLESLKAASDFESRNINYLYQYDMTLGFPTESGLPFMYTLTIPKLARISSGRGLTDKNASLELTVAGHLLSSEKLQSRIGFVTPFEHRHYIAGIDINTQIFIPAGLSVKKSEKRNKFQIEIHPREYYRYGTGHIAVHHSVVPYTASHIVLSHMPVPSSNDTRLVNTKEPQKIEFALGSAIFAARSDQFDTETSKKMGIEALGAIANVFRNSGAHYKKFDVIVYLTAAQINITLDGSETFDFDSSEATIPATIDKQPESEARKTQFLKEVSKDVKSAINYVYDLSILTEDNQHVLTLAGATSRVNNKHQVLLYWNIQSPSDGEVLLEFCTIGYEQSSRSVPLNFNKTTEQMPKSEFKAEIRDGSSENGQTIRLKGNWTRTDDAKRMAMRSEIVENCQQEIKKGNIWTPTCKRASDLVNRKDHFMMSIDTDSDQIYTLFNKIILFIKMFVSKGNMEMPIWGSANENTIDMEIKMQPDNNDAKISLRTSNTDVEFSLKDIFEKGLNISNILEEDTDGSMCVLDKTQAVTFDEKIYPLKLGNCWHVMTTTYPKGSPFNTEKLMNIPKYLRVMILAREMDDGSKQIRMILDDQEIYLKKSGNDLEATVNSRIVDVSGNKTHQEDTFEIYRLDGMIAIFSSEHEIYAVYDGERILLHSSFKYLTFVRGLCGNYDLRSDNDFIVPKNCIVTKPEEFTATYALTEENCQGPALQNKQKAEQSTCISRLPRPSDVISDREAGRSPNKNRRWSYH